MDTPKTIIKVRQMEAVICKLAQCWEQDIITRSRLKIGIEEQPNYVHVLEERERGLYKFSDENINNNQHYFNREQIYQGIREYYKSSFQHISNSPLIAKI